jgi:4-alpha-glucanotransferase
MPVSKLFWNEVYVSDPDAPAGRHGADGRKRGDERQIDYRAAMAERRARLEVAARTARESELAAFMARNPRAAEYARFRALTDRHGAWTGWPDRLRARDVRPDDYDPELARYHLYAQWQAERQLAEAEERAAARGVSLYLDLPLGVHPHGYDTWRERALFAFNVTVGAPPDPLAPAGQDWGIHPPSPEASRLDGHRYFIAAIRKHLRFARVLRIDHIMQLHRLFWVPGGDAREGVYVRYPYEELYAILSLEAHRRGAVIVGEDLGTVPRSVRRGMRRHGVPGMYVVQFSLREVEPVEQVEPRPTSSNASGAGAGPGLMPGRAAEGAVASIGTHDTPMFGAWWTGRDAEIRAERGLMDAEEAAAEVVGRRELREKLARGLGVEVDGVAVQEALYRVLGRSEAGLVLASLEDLWMETEPQNVPGTPAELNWRRRTSRPLEAVREGDAARLLAVLNEARKGRA